MLAMNNQTKFNEVVSESLAKAANFPRWQNAINKGVVQLELQGEFITWDAEAKGLVIWSQDSNEVYSSNGICQCVAFKKGFPCWHRALARIVRLYMEGAETLPICDLCDKPSNETGGIHSACHAKEEMYADGFAAEMDSAPYMRISRNVTPEFCGNIRIN